MAGPESGCKCCGTCCRKGGPALHIEDADLVASGFLTLDDLITVRRGEHVLHPLSDKPQPAAHEFVKIRGKGADWCCAFLDDGNSRCTIYEHRPLACRLLKCWAPEDLLAITGKNLLTRFAIIPENDPLAPLVEEHEAACSVMVMNSLAAQMRSPELQKEILAELTSMVTFDCRLRSYAVSAHKLSLARELFYFGRPLFQLLVPFGIESKAAPGGIILQHIVT